MCFQSLMHDWLMAMAGWWFCWLAVAGYTWSWLALVWSMVIVMAGHGWSLLVLVTHGEWLGHVVQSRIVVGWSQLSVYY